MPADPSQPAVAVLNYHRILPSELCVGFYDVSDITFIQQMQTLADRVVDSKAGYLSLDNGISVVLTFDDGTEDHFSAAEHLSELGLTGTFFIVSGLADAPNRLSSDQIGALARQGHRIGSHAVNHRKLVGLEHATLWTELTESKQVLEQLTSRPVNWFAPPGGFWSDALVSAAASAGYEVVRTMDWGYSRHPVHGLTPVLPVLPTYDLRGFTNLLEGRAPIWKHRVKTVAKKIVGETLYVHARDGLDSIRRRLG